MKSLVVRGYPGKDLKVNVDNDVADALQKEENSLHWVDDQIRPRFRDRGSTLIRYIASRRNLKLPAPLDGRSRRNFVAPRVTGPGVVDFTEKNLKKLNPELA